MAKTGKDLLTVTQLKGKDAQPKEKDFLLSDGGGLFLRVMKTGGRSWVFVYKDAARRNQTITLGQYPDTSIAAARDKAKALREMRAEGLDPKEELQRQAEAELREQHRLAELARLEAAKLTMQALFAEWDEHHGAALDSHWREVRRSHWRVHLAPVFGVLKVEDARHSQAMTLFDRMVKDGKEATARKVLVFLRQLIAWAKERGHAAANHELLTIAAPKLPKRVADDQLPENFDIEAHLARHGEGSIGDDGEETLAGRALQFAELVALLHERLPQSTQAESGKRLIRLLLATGLRGVEGTRLRWNWISLDRRLMIVPAGAAKKRKQLHVHLSDYALAQLQEMQGLRIPGNDYVFPAPNVEGKSIRRDNVGNDIAHRQFYDLPDETEDQRATRLEKRHRYKRASKDMRLYNLPGGKWTFYDLRRTAATRLEELGISRDIVGQVLNHARPDAKTTGRYARYSNWEARCRALDLLGQALAECEGGRLPACLADNVTPIFKSA